MSYADGDHFVVRDRFAWRSRWPRMRFVPTNGRSNAKRVYGTKC